MNKYSKYPFSTINKPQIKTAAQRALIAADSFYHAWPTQQQEKFRATMDENAQIRLRRVLLDSLLNIKCSFDDVDTIWSDISSPKFNLLTWASLLTQGIGEDFIYLNEIMAENTSLLDFNTLYDYDYDDYLFQQRANQKEFPDYKAMDYYAFKHPAWIKLLISDDFYYATLTSIATQLCDDIGTAGEEYIDHLIPHELVEGKNHGKPEKGGVLWDMEDDANGFEAPLKELRQRWYSYLEERWLEISKVNIQLEPVVYSKDNHWDNDPHRSFIFCNEETLKKVRWRYFVSDCTSLMADYALIEKQLKQEVSDARCFLDENCQDILKNFDPNVVKLLKKRQVIVSAEVLQQLESSDHDDEST